LNPEGISPFCSVGLFFGIEVNELEGVMVMGEEYKQYCTLWITDEMKKRVVDQRMSARQAAKEVSKIMEETLSSRRVREVWAESRPRTPDATNGEEDSWPTCGVCNKNMVKKAPRSKNPLEHGMCSSCRENFNMIQNGIDPEAERYWGLVAGRITRFKESIQNEGKPQTDISGKCRRKVVRALEEFVANLKDFEKDMTYGWKL
jgi:hypothetical protein